MSDVGIVWSTTNGGDAVSTTIDHGDKTNGETSTYQEVFLRHTGVNPITSCQLYIRPVSDGYSGDVTALDDFAEVISWGDGAVANDFGGFHVNMNAAGSYPSAAWPTLSSKSPTNGFCCRTGVGDSSANAVTITTATGASSSGTIQAGSAPNVRFACRVVIPTSEDTVGTRQWEQILLYSYTS